MRKFRGVVLGSVCVIVCACRAAPTELGAGIDGGTRIGGAAERPAAPFLAATPGDLIGGPMAEGRAGDVLLRNDVVRLVIQRPGKYPGVGSFGGNIIDADLVRRDATGHDQFGVMQPLINVEWSLDAVGMEAFADFDLEKYLQGALTPLTGAADPKTTQSILVHQHIDTYEFLDIDFLEPLAKALTGQNLFYAGRFDDMNDPFQAFDLRNIRTDAFTEYRLAPGASYVEMRTTLFNDGDEPVALPVGDFVNGSGALQLLIPGQGFAPQLADQIISDTPALIYAGQPGVDVSYGYFYDLHQFVEAGGKNAGERLKTASLSYSGVTGMLLGEGFTKIFPLGGGSAPEIHFSVPAHDHRTITRYFVVGDGSAGSVLDAGMKILKIPTKTVSGRVVDTHGSGVAAAEVAILSDKGKTIVTYRTDGQGRFSGTLSTGVDSFAQAFGSGQYTVKVEKPGYADGATALAGHCTPDTIDLVHEHGAVDVQCVLGDSGVVTFAGPMHDAKTGAAIPVRVTILGRDPSPDRARPGVFTDLVMNDRPYAVADLHYLNRAGGLDTTTAHSLRLEPGNYIFTFSRGPEYELATQIISVATFGETTVAPGVLHRVIKTPGYISADFHVHAQASPDSGVPAGMRAMAGAGEGLDVLHSSDHDYLFDYAPVVSELESRGLIAPAAMGTIVGDEISPNHLGHIHAFPLMRDEVRAAGGALDWSYSPRDRNDPSPDFTMTIQEILDHVRESHHGDLVLQINHVSDVATSLLSLAGLVTSTAYRDIDGVQPLSTYSDPMGLRLPYDGPADLPIPFAQTPHFSRGFTAMELSIGSELTENKLLETGLPQWFNLLNLGLILTATADSDSHVVNLPIGLPRNFIRSDLDPADKIGADFSTLDHDAYAAEINAHHVVVSAGPYVQITATSETGEHAEVGDLIHAQSPTVRVEVYAPSWAWFDSIEIFANTEPTPMDDDKPLLMDGTAAHAKTFYEPYHRPHFSYHPYKNFRLRDGTLTSWEEKNGVIHAVVEFSMTLDHDTWVMAFARGTTDTPGFRSLFPMATHSHGGDGKQPDHAAASLQELAADSALAVPAWGFTNPIFFDIDGDTNGDGNPFEALYVKQGKSPLH